MIRHSSFEKVVHANQQLSATLTNHESRITNYDLPFLHHAARLAARGLGRTWPNPSVGCVLVKNNHVLAATRTADGGRPHAETQALTIAGDAARGATAYVTLEPCAHHGQTPPCAQALIDAGIARVVMGAKDPDPRVAGKGAAMLRAAGVDVELFTIHDSQFTDINRGFFRRIEHGLPHVAMKLATTTDYFMARGDGGGQWITGEAARAHGNQLRGGYDCLLTGIGTVLTDNPQMNVRPPNLPNPSMVRVVADRHVRLPLKSHLVKTAHQQPTWVITSAEAVELAASHATELREAGVTFFVVEDGMLSPRTILHALASEGITRVFIEAGPALSSDFLTARAVETLHWYRAPITLRNAGKSPIDALQPTLANGRRSDMRRLGDDIYERIELY